MNHGGPSKSMCSMQKIQKVPGALVEAQKNLTGFWNNQDPGSRRVEATE